MLKQLVCLGTTLLPLKGSTEDPPQKRITVDTIIDVDVALEKEEPPNLLITATGEVPPAGYTDAQLHRASYEKPPADGIQDYFLTAMRPNGVVAQVVTKVNASNRVIDYQTKAPWSRGVRIHGVGKGVLVKMALRQLATADLAHRIRKQTHS